MSTNGFVSFGDPSHLRRGALFSFLNTPVIAPLWAEFDFRSSGSLYYRTSRDSVLLKMVADIIANENPELNGFHPTSCVVITWFQALIFSRRFEEVNPVAFFSGATFVL